MESQDSEPSQMSNVFVKRAVVSIWKTNPFLGWAELDREPSVAVPTAPILGESAGGVLGPPHLPAGTRPPLADEGWCGNAASTYDPPRPLWLWSPHTLPPSQGTCHHHDWTDHRLPLFSLRHPLGESTWMQSRLQSPRVPSDISLAHCREDGCGVSYLRPHVLCL